MALVACLQEHHLTAGTLQNLLTALPVKVLKKIQKLSRETGDSVETIVEHAVDLYEKRRNARLTTGNDELARIMRDPEKRAIFDEITHAMSQRAHASTTAAQKTARGKLAGAARAKSLTKEERSSIAKAAALARWGKKKEQRKDE